MAPHSSTLAWKTPWTEKPGGLQSMRSLRVGHDWPTSLSLFTFMCWRRKWQPTPVFLPGESQGRGSLVYGVVHRVGHNWSDLGATAAALLEEHTQRDFPKRVQPCFIIQGLKEKPGGLSTEATLGRLITQLMGVHFRYKVSAGVPRKVSWGTGVVRLT